MRQWLRYHLPSNLAASSQKVEFILCLALYFACLFVSGSRLRDEQSFHADSDGIKPSSPGQRHPDVLPVDSRSHHFRHRCQRSPLFPNKPQADQAGGGGPDGNGPDDVFSGGSRSLHAAGSKVGHQAALGLPCSSRGVRSTPEFGEPSSWKLISNLAGGMWMKPQAGSGTCSGAFAQPELTITPPAPGRAGSEQLGQGEQAELGPVLLACSGADHTFKWSRFLCCYRGQGCFVPSLWLCLTQGLVLWPVWSMYFINTEV